MKNKWDLGGKKRKGEMVWVQGVLVMRTVFSRMLFSFSCRLGFLCFDIPALCTTRNGIW